MLNNLIDKIKLSFRKDKELYFSLYEIIGFYPHNIEYYKMALMHKSIMHRNNKGKPVNNERLEFLGDAILDAIVGDIVYHHFPGKREGFLTNTRSKLVQRETLNKLAQDMGINELILSNGHSSSHNNYMGGNAFEALVGAIYLDRGYNACMQFMQQRILTTRINLDKLAYKEVNFKSKLIEWSQKNRVKIEFVLLQQKVEKGGSPVFIYQVVLEGVEGCSGQGYSKKESQQLAAKLTLEKLKREPQFIDLVFQAKTNRTKMEEEPVEIVPDTEEKDDFYISSSANETKISAPQASIDQPLRNNEDEDEEFDLSHISRLDVFYGGRYMELDWTTRAVHPINKYSRPSLVEKGGYTVVRRQALQPLHCRFIGHPVPSKQCVQILCFGIPMDATNVSILLKRRDVNPKRRAISSTIL